MQNQLRCLLIDDNPDDRALVRRELQREFPDIQIEEITRHTELASALQKPFDFVITDFQLRWTDGSVVLQLIKQHRPDCPVIMFTGTGSEEIAVAAMKAGLDDYVLKSPKHYARVATAVRSTLERIESKQRVARLEIRLQSLLNRLHVGIFRAAEDGTLLEANPCFLNLLGLTSVEGVNLHELFSERDDYAQSLERLKISGHLHEHEIQLRHADGAPLWVSLTQTLNKISEIEMVIDGLIEDMTERVKLETELRQTQKMESVGQLAAGIAHDFNNILTIIQGYANVLLSDHEMRPESRLSLEQISSAAERAATLTRQLLTFCRKQVMQTQIVDLNESVGNMSKLLRSLLGEDISLELEYTPSLPPVEADSTMLEQLIVNLAINARDAMPTGGRLTIGTEHLEIGSPYDRAHPETRAGHFVRLRIADTGVGMDAAVLVHLFEPFFTTKDIGKGAGLGLAAVYGIVKQHHGWIEVTSKVGQGTAFEIFLPCRVHVVSAPRTQEPIAMPQGSETILVVEDEPVLRELVCEILQGCGYEVLNASSGKEALKIWRADKIDLLLTDMQMPEINGLELAQKLLAEKPELKILYTSGYTPDLVESNFKLRAGLRFLQKPYQPEALIQAVRNCLDN